MAIEIRDLSEVSISELVEAFNSAFSDYVIPLKLTEEALRFKLDSELIDMTYSVGAFDQGTLVSFMLTGVRTEDGLTRYYNAGTGVTPNYRGQRLVAQMYTYVLPIWKEKSANSTLQLEVIKGNDKAIRAYKSQGYTINRDLLCFKGEPNEVLYTVRNITISTAEEVIWEELQAFWDIQPSWQNAVAVLDQIKEDVCFKLAKYDYETVGYIAYHKSSGKIFQLAVSKAYRNKGIGKLLMNDVMTTLRKPLLITNVDHNGTDTIEFLKGVGLEHYITQHEMVRSL